jgi:hypothetical protein
MAKVWRLAQSGSNDSHNSLGRARPQTSNLKFYKPEVSALPSHGPKIVLSVTGGQGVPSSHAITTVCGHLPTVVTDSRADATA